MRHRRGVIRRDAGARGSILRAADSVRVNYVLVDTATLKQIDAYSSTAAASEAFGLQDRVATWAASALALKLSREEQQTLVAAAPGAPAALEVFLEGRGYLLNFQQPGNIDRAIEKFDRAIALESAIRARLLGPRHRVLAEIRSDAGHGARGAGPRRLRAGDRARRAARRVARVPRHDRARHRTGRAGSASTSSMRSSASRRATRRRSASRARRRGPARRPRPKRPIERAIALRPQYLGDARLARQVLSRARTLRRGGHALRACADLDARQCARLLHPVRDVRHRLGRAL